MKLAFIGGTGRCGTSITRELLGRSTKVSVLPFEHRILIDPDAPIDFLNSLDLYRDPFKIDIALKRMISHLENLDNKSFLKSLTDSFIKKTKLSKYITPSKYSGWNLSSTFNNYQEELFIFKKRIRSFSYEGRWVGSKSYKIKNTLGFFSHEDKKEFASIVNNFYSALVSNYLEKQQTSHFVEDSTWNVLNLRGLDFVFPNSKFVHVYRDPRDVIASFTNQLWMPSDIYQAVKIYKDLITEILKQTENFDNCHELCFEDLVNNSELEIKQLCNYLELEVTQSMLDFDLNKSNIGRYKVDFNEQEIETLNKLLSKELKYLGYA